MRKRAERTLSELYGITEKITAPEITPVLEGSCRIQGPVEELDREIYSSKSGSFPSEKRFMFVNKSFSMRVESGTCNVCSAPCTCCMHNNRTVLAMESKMDCGSSQNSCATKDADACSFTCADGMPFYKSRMCDDSQPAASEASASSSHDSYSENAESKATPRATVTCEHSEDVDMPFVPLTDTIKDQHCQKKRNAIGDCLFSSDSHITSDLCHRKSIERNDRRQGVEHGVDIYSPEGIKDSNIKEIHHDMDLDKEISTCSSILADAVHCSEVENTVHSETTGGMAASENKQKKSNHMGQLTCPKENLLKKCTDSPTVVFSGKSDLTEVHVRIDNSSPKVRPPLSPPRDGVTSSQNAKCKDSDGSSGYHHIEGESSLGAQLTFSSLEENKPRLHFEAGSSENCCPKDTLMVTDSCLGNAKGLDKETPSNDVSNTIVKELEDSYCLVESRNMQELQLQPQQMREGENSESEPELLDVKVCDICGDAGREELLAVCSRCSDGAEHTYCMRVKLHKVPEGDWLCEECQIREDSERKKVDRTDNVVEAAKTCKLKEDNEIKKVDRSAKVSATAKEFKLKEYAEVKGNKSEIVSGTSGECKRNNGSKKFVKSEAEPGPSKPTCLNKNNQNIASISNVKLMPKLEMKTVDLDVKKVPKGVQSPKCFAKKHVDSQGIISSSGKRTSEMSGESFELGSPRKKPALSHVNSFKNMDTGKGGVAIMPLSNGGQSMNSSKGFSRSLSMSASQSSKDSAQTQSVPLPRSNSFNVISKPKVKQLTEPVPFKSKISRSSLFKNISSHYHTESSKTQGIPQSRVESHRSLKQGNERNLIAKKRSMMDRVPSNLSPRAGTSSPLPRIDEKAPLRGVKLNNGSESNKVRTSKGSAVANGLGTKEVKKKSANPSKILGSTPLNAKVNYEDQRPRTPKEGAYENSNAMEKSYKSETIQNRGVVQTVESTHQNDKMKDPSIHGGLRLVVSGGIGDSRCQRCNELGHLTEACSTEKLQASILKPSAEKNSNAEIKKGSKWKDAVETTILKSRLQKINKQSDQLKEIPDNTEVSSEIASEEFIPSSLNHPRNGSLEVGMPDGQDVSRDSEVHPTKAAHVPDVRPQSCRPAEISCTSRIAEAIEASCTAEASKLNATDAVVNELNMKHLLHFLPNQQSTSAIPELEFIWQGSFEVLKTGSEPVPFDGIQAHLSTSASPKVLAVVEKLPCRVNLEEVSFISCWPLQSQGISPNEHNIALFFFAKDVESYERSYSKLLEKMLKNDLALRGINDGVELLIFPSTKLPVHCQRWNRLYFLWGLFKGAKTGCPTSLPSTQWKSLGPNLNVDPDSQDLSCTDIQIVASVEDPQELSRSQISPMTKPPKFTTNSETSAISSSNIEDRLGRVQDSSLPHDSSFQSAANSRLLLEQSSFIFPVDRPLSSTNQFSKQHDTVPESRFQTTNFLPLSAVKDDGTHLENLCAGSEGRHVATPSVQYPATDEQSGFSRGSPSYSSSDWKKDLESGRSEKDLGKEEVPLENIAVVSDGSQRILTGEAHASFKENPSMKRARSCSSEALFQASGEITKNSGENALLITGLNHLPMTVPLDYEREQKRMCFSDGHATGSSREVISSARSSSKVHPLTIAYVSEQHRECTAGSSSEPVPPYNLGKQEEKFLFPVTANLVQNARSENPSLIHILSSDDEDEQEPPAPNLELALWAKQTPQMRRQRKWLDGDDNVSASLSLSLAVSTSDNERPLPSTKSEPQLLDRLDLNASLFPFDGFPGT